MPELRIVHTSDFHDRLTPAKAARLRELKREHDAILIDSGDAIRAPNVAVMPWRERAIRLMNEAGYDALGLGNREYFFRQRGMAWKWGHAAFPVVASNLRGRGRGPVRGASTSLVVRSSAGLRLGLFSLMPTMVAPGHGFERLSDTRFIPWQDAAREALSDLVDRSDFIAALFHRPPEEVPELLELCPEVGLVLSGHSHLSPDALDCLPSGAVVSHAGVGARHARLLGLRAPGGAVTMDELVGLGAEAPP